MIFKTDESPTWFHFDDLDGGQISILFVSCLIFTEKYKHRLLLWCKHQALPAPQGYLRRRLPGATLFVLLKIH